MKILTGSEKVWLNARFPKLAVTATDGRLTIVGELIIDMFCDTTIGRSIIFPDKDVHLSNQYIHDIYQIRVDYKEDLFIPEVYETSGRIKEFAQRKGILLADLHIYDNGCLCLCPKPLEKIILSDQYMIWDFFEKLVIPYFYAHSYYEKNNRQPPWVDYSHGDIGILECYNEYALNAQDKVEFVADTINSLRPENQKTIRSMDQINRQSLCFCGSGIKFRKCHHELWKVAKKLKEANKKMGSAN